MKTSPIWHIINQQIQVQRTLNRIPKKSKPRYIIIKLLKTKDKEKILTATREK